MAPRSFSPDEKKEPNNLSLYVGLLPILFLFALIAALHLLLRDHATALTVFEPPLLLPILNTVFLSLASCVVAYVAMRSYLFSGSPTILLLGCGVLTLGAGALLAGWLIGPEGVNANVTIFNLSILSASIFHMAGTITSLKEKPPETDLAGRRRKLARGYLAVLVLVALYALGAVAGVMPPFFIQGVGPTVLRQAVLAVALALFTISSVAMMILFIQNNVRFLFWYSLALALLVTAILGAYLQPAVGSPMGWAGRSAQYLAGIYFIVAVFSALRDARAWGVTLNAAIAELFKESRAYLQDILTTVSDAIVSCHDGGKVLQWNQAAERVFGYLQAEVLGKSLNLILPDKHEIDLERLRDSELSGPGIIEMKLKRRDGVIFSGEVSVSTRRLSIGKVFTLLIRDITERKKAEQALRDSEAKANALFKYAPIGIYEIDYRGPSFISVNDTVCQILGYTREELFSIGPSGLLDDNGQALFADRIRRQLAGEKIEESVEYRVRKKDGSFIMAILNVSLNLPGGGPGRALVVAYDITERKRAEEELRRHRDELEARVRERTAELRESGQRLRHLSMELLNAQEKERRVVAQEIHDSIGASMAAAKYKVESALAQISADNPQTKSLLESIIPIIQEAVNEARRIQMNLRPSILDDLGILATINWFCRQYESTYSGIRVKQEIHIEEHEVSDSLKTVIFRVLQEAMNNIAKHSKANEVVLALRKTDPAIELVVRDNGRGFKVEDILSRKSSSRGLGLDSMRERTELTGGTFTIESTDSGTVIQASWPR